MIKIEEAFKNKKAFIPFVLAGYPNLEATEKFILKMAEAGADLIEIGIPFSDQWQKEQLFKRLVKWL